MVFGETQFREPRSYQKKPGGKSKTVFLKDEEAEKKEGSDNEHIEPFRAVDSDGQGQLDVGGAARPGDDG
jgi:hypothetical protein